MKKLQSLGKIENKTHKNIEKKENSSSNSNSQVIRIQNQHLQGWKLAKQNDFSDVYFAIKFIC